MSSQPNLSEHRDFHKLDTLRANVELSFHELHDGVKHHGYEKIEEYSEKFSKDVMTFLNNLRHLKDSLNSAEPSDEIIEQLDDSSEFIMKIQGYLDLLKTLSKSYKQNDNFNHTNDLRRIMENEDMRIIELEQAVQSVQGLIK